MRMLLIPGILLAAVFSLAPPSQAAPAKQTDALLVDKLVVLFEQMAGSPIKVDAVLDELMASAKTAKVQKQVDDAFFQRYARLLRVFKLMTLEDKEGILRPITERECIAFIRDVQGDAPESCSVSDLAKAITHELESLKG